MDIAIVGAGGTMGRNIAIALLRERVLSTHGRLQLVGHRGGQSERTLPGVAADLMDAFAEDAPEIDVVFSPKDVVADIVVLALGATLDGPGAAASRTELRAHNLPLVATYARALARHGHGEELLLVLTNPVEACVAEACRYLPRRRVIGLGAYLDTLRFRRELALSLGVRREKVQGLVVGEHGLHMVPCLSTVRVQGFEHPEGRARIAGLRRLRRPAVVEAVQRVATLLQQRGAEAAYEYAGRLDPDLRTVVRPFVTQLCGARTPAGTSEMVVRFLSTLLQGGQVFAAAQVMLQGEWLGIEGVTGAPVVMSLRGVERVVPYELEPSEARAVLNGVCPPLPSSRARQASEVSSEASRRYLCQVTCVSGSEPGLAERVTKVFTDRGINIEQLHTSLAPRPRIDVRFVAPPFVSNYVRRRLRRLRGTRGVHMGLQSEPV